MQCRQDIVLKRMSVQYFQLLCKYRNNDLVYILLRIASSKASSLKRLFTGVRFQHEYNSNTNIIVPYTFVCSVNRNLFLDCFQIINLNTLCEQINDIFLKL